MDTLSSISSYYDIPAAEIPGYQMFLNVFLESIEPSLEENTRGIWSARATWKTLTPAQKSPYLEAAKEEDQKRVKDGAIYMNWKALKRGGEPHHCLAKRFKGCVT